MEITPFCRTCSYLESEDQPTDYNPLFPPLLRTYSLARFAWSKISENISTIQKTEKVCPLITRPVRVWTETHVMSSWNQLRCRRNTKLRSRSFRVVVSSISSSGLSVMRPWEDPFRSNRRCIRYSEQNKLAMTMNRVWISIEPEVSTT